MKDGWHKICGYNVYVENDRVVRGTKANGTLPAYVYRACRTGGWNNDCGITVNAFRSGVRRGTIRMFYEGRMQMKYVVTAYVDEDKKYEVNVTVKRNAKKRTVFIKCMNAVGQMLVNDKILTTGKYGFETPCLNNGCLGAAWFNDPFINVTIQEETGAWIAL